MKGGSQPQCERCGKPVTEIRVKKTKPPFGSELVNVLRIIGRGKKLYGGKIVCAPCQVALRRGEAWEMAAAKTNEPSKQQIPPSARNDKAPQPTKIEVQPSLIENFGDLAEICAHHGGWV